MHREEKRRKFHEAVLNTLYPPPSPLEAVDEEKTPGHALEDFDVELINTDDFVRTGSGSDEIDDVDDDGGVAECEPQKLTRAQRKRLRKKKLKEHASRRSKIIGPLLPPKSEEDGDYNDRGGENQRPGVRQNASEECAVTRHKPREVLACSNQNKLKHRRMAKRVAKEREKFSGAENYDEAQSFEFFINRENSDQDQKTESLNTENCDQAQANRSNS